jgi:hypothetical protein
VTTLHLHAAAKMKRKIVVDDAAPSGEPGVNPFTGKPYSDRYYEILKGREGTFAGYRGRATRSS